MPTGLAECVIHVSTHTRDTRAHPRVSSLCMANWQDATSAQALPRVALQAEAAFVPRDSDPYLAARDACRERFAHAVPTFELGDFSIALLHPASARLVAGFGRAYSLPEPELLEWMRG